MITILTTTYNRAHTLERLYESLCSQDDKDFEWVIVDDGSADNTFEVFKRFSTEGRLSIRYFYQDNKGKHSAINNGVDQALKEWIFIVDSDDTVKFDAVRIVKEKIKLYNQRNLVGLAFRKSYFDGKLIGVAFDDSRDIELTPTQAGNYFKGDLAYIFKKEKMLLCKFPVFKNEKFVPELYIWNQLSDLGEIIFSKSVTIYFSDYLSDGYTKNFKKNLKKNPLGFFVFYSSQIGREKNLKFKLKNLIRSVQCFFWIIYK